MSACGCAGHSPACRCGQSPTNDARDLVARLRAYYEEDNVPQIVLEAADRIEELEGEIDAMGETDD